MSQTKAQLVTNVSSGFNVTGVVTATKFDGALATNATGTNLTLSGDLTVQGSQTIINSDTLDVKDKTVGIASTSTPTSATQNNSGIEIYGPSNVTIKYDDQQGGIGINTGLTASGFVTATSFSNPSGAAAYFPNGITGTTAEYTAAQSLTIADTIAHKGDTNTKIRFLPDTITTETNGSERVRITSAGRVGIGTDSASALLHIEGTETNLWLERNSQTLKFDANYGNGGDQSLTASSAFRIYTGGANERLRIRSEGGFKFSNASLTERVKITAGKLSDNQDINLDNGMVHYFTTQETTTSTPNITASAGINTIMSAGDTMVVTIITTAAAAGYSAQLSIEGAGVTENWIGGTAPAAGGASGVDIYSYTIIKTGTGTTDFTVIGNLSKTSA